MREKLPRVASARALEGKRLALRFDDGWETTVDLTAFIAAFHSLAPLEEPATFAAVKVEEWGSGVTWDDEGTLSIAATSLYRLAAEQGGDDARRFDAWMVRHGFSASRAAEALGITRRTIINYRTGSRPVPKVVALACRAIDLEQRIR